MAGGDGAAPAADIGAHARVTALVAAPNGTLQFADHVSAVGSFVAFDVAVGDHTHVAFESGFSASQAAGAVGQQQLHGYYGPNPDPSIAPVVGPVPPDTIVKLSIGLPLRDEAGLTTLLDQISDPTNPNYRHYLTLEQFTQTYGPTSADYQAVIDWAQSHALTVRHTYANNLLIDVSASAATVAQALFANLVYRKRADGSAFITVDREPSVDVQTPLQYISGLDLTFLPRPAGGSGPGGGLWGWDFRNAYLGIGTPCAALTGAGRTIGLLEMDTFQPSDVPAYIDQALVPTTQNPLPRPGMPTVVGGTTFGGGDTGKLEVALDIDAVLAMAPGATVTSFESDFLGVAGTLEAMATTVPALSVMSSSWSYPWGPNQENVIMEMAAQGTTVLDASGDTGSGGDPQDNTDYVYQTLVGGTVLSTVNLVSSSPLIYPTSYYRSEASWIAGFRDSGWTASKGGVMSGASCVLGYPFPGCGPGAQPLPSSEPVNVNETALRTDY